MDMPIIVDIKKFVAEIIQRPSDSKVTSIGIDGHGFGPCMGVQFFSLLLSS